MENNKNFLKINLIRLRNKAGLTQDELANAAHITLTGYQKIEYGRSSGKAKTISDLAKALGVTVEDLYRDPNEKIEQKSPLDQAFMLTEAQIKALSEDAATKGVKAAMDAINKPTVSKQDDSNKISASKQKLLKLIDDLSEDEAKYIFKQSQGLIDSYRELNSTPRKSKVKQNQ